MRFKLSSTALSNKLSALARVINPKNSLPILGDFVFQTEGTSLKLTASDGENTVVTKVELAESESDGSFAIDSSTILDAVKSLAEQPITFNLTGGKLIISYQNGQFTLPIDNYEEYPTVSDITGEYSSVTMKSSVLAENIGRSVFATAQDTLRPVMSGIYFDLTPENLSIVASDGHKLVRTKVFGLSSDTPKSFVLPKKPSMILGSMLEKDESDVQIIFSDAKAQIHFNDTVLTCSLIEGKYPNYNTVIPQNNNNEIVVDRHAMLSAIKRVVPFSNSASNLIRFRIDNGTITLDAEDIDFSRSATEKLNCDYDGIPMSIGFKGTAFADVLSNFSCDYVLIKLADSSRAGLVLPAEQPEGQEVLMLIMPMLISE